MGDELKGITVAVPESRAADTLCRMLEERGAAVRRCPLVAITDTPDRQSVADWLRRFIAHPKDDVILYTGEGVRRLTAFAEELDLVDAFIEALGKTRKITRGPKPVQALRAIGLKSDLPAGAPTTDGIIETLRECDLTDHDVGVQLYGQPMKEALRECLAAKGARVDPVSPYVYVPASEAGDVADLIRDMAAGGVDVLALTSSPQFDRLVEVAKAGELTDTLATGLGRTRIAVIGPVLADKLSDWGKTPDIIGPAPYAMKPFVRRITAAMQD